MMHPCPTSIIVLSSSSFLSSESFRFAQASPSLPNIAQVYSDLPGLSCMPGLARTFLYARTCPDFPVCPDLPGLSCMPRLARTCLDFPVCSDLPRCLDLPGLSCMPGLARNFLYVWTFLYAQTSLDFPVCSVCPDLPGLNCMP